MPKQVCQHCGQPIETAGSGTDDLNRGKGPLLAPTDVSRAKSLKLTLPPIPPPEKFPIAQVAAIAQQIIANTEKVIVGKHEQIVLAVAALLAEGHLLVEDVPGVAKTMLARAIAQSAGCSFKRIQCTPDLHPLDILGEAHTDPSTGKADFSFGPLFSQFVLVDEINRASPRTQAALLEAMGEASVTAGKITYHLEHPFMVIATQNPIEHEGTFLLSEAQKDRFLIRLSLGYPDLNDEREMCERFQLGHPIESLKSATTPDRILECQKSVRAVGVDARVCDQILALVRATREHPALVLGASPRGSLGLFRMAQAMAAIQGNESVSVEQVRALAGAVLAHRLIVKPELSSRYRDGREIIAEIMEGRQPA
jgi:MoxR-like ATPase